MLIHATAGRIYGLDLGTDHHNPSCTYTGERHKHRWTPETRDKEAYGPSDIIADASDPETVWRQFCGEAKIRHDGPFQMPQVQQELL
mgnify:CR=1 FL=1